MDRRTLTNADVQAIANAFQAKCTCNLGPEAQREMSHLMGMIKDTGGGDHSKGIEIMRDFLKRYARAQTWGDYIGRGLVLTFFLLVAGYIGSWVVEGAINSLSKAMGK